DTGLGGSGQHQFHGSETPVKLLSYGFWQRGGIKCWTREKLRRLEGNGWLHGLWFWQQSIWEGGGQQGRGSRRQQAQGKMTGKCELLQIDQQMSLGSRFSHHFPDRCFHQLDRKLM